MENNNKECNLETSVHSIGLYHPITIVMNSFRNEVMVWIAS